MSTTLTIARDQLHLLEPGDRIVAVDGDRLSVPHVVAMIAGSAAGPVALRHPQPEVNVEWFLYQGTIARDLTVERGPAEPAAVEEPPAPSPAPPAPPRSAPVFSQNPEMPNDYAASWDDPARERRALRRNGTYVALLDLLDAHGPGWVDLRDVYGDTGTYSDAGRASHSLGTMGTFYGWTERQRPYVVRLTDRGRRALATARREGLI